MTNEEQLLVKNLIMFLKRFAYQSRNLPEFDRLREQVGDYLIKNDKTQHILRELDNLNG
jgi:hypothetical protein